jgi:hypothetical protein
VHRGLTAGLLLDRCKPVHGLVIAKVVWIGLDPFLFNGNASCNVLIGSSSDELGTRPSGPKNPPSSYQDQLEDHIRAHVAKSAGEGPENFPSGETRRSSVIVRQ